MEVQVVKQCTKCFRSLLFNHENFEETKSGYTKTCRMCLEKKRNKKPSWSLSKCEHDKIRMNCIHCQGSQTCKHNKIKHNCVICGGSNICQHNIRKENCIECCGSNICVHKKFKQICEQCGGSKLCKHRRQKYHCKACGGQGYCEHGKQKYKCNKCGGSGICKHGIEKRSCKVCGGSAICEHNVHKQYCKKCKDPIHVSFTKLLTRVRSKNKQLNIYNETNFIDLEYLKDLLNKNNGQCMQCNCVLEFKGKTANSFRVLLTESSLGYSKGNCVLKCQSCTIKRGLKRKRQQ